MKAYFAFTDECGDYTKERNARFLAAHPFYVRSTVIMPFDDYQTMQAEMNSIKARFGLKPDVEVKWSHFGSALKNNYTDIPHRLSSEQLASYFSQIFKRFIAHESICVYLTFTDNREVHLIGEIPLLKMHLQNALQKVQTTMQANQGFAIVVADDLNSKSKVLKQAAYQITTTGDFVNYTNIKQGFYVDYSNQCCGLQIADLCAGVFTAMLKWMTAPVGEKHKYELGHNLFCKYLFSRIRCSTEHLPCYEVYRYGIKEVPGHVGEQLAKETAELTERLLESAFQKWLNDLNAQDMLLEE